MMTSSAPELRMALGVALNDRSLVVQQFAVGAFVGLDEHEGNLQPLKLVDNGAADLAVAADNKVVPQAIDVHFVDHGSPGLHAVAAENSQEHALGDPDLQREYSRVNEH